MSKRGRPRIYEPSSFQGAPQITVRMPPDLLEWVKSQGGAVFLRRLAEEARARDPLTEALEEAVDELQAVPDSQGRRKPMSMCICGHTGDGPNSQHRDTPYGETGHGRCVVDACKCRQFSWRGLIGDAPLDVIREERPHEGERTVRVVNVVREPQSEGVRVVNVVYEPPQGEADRVVHVKMTPVSEGDPGLKELPVSEHLVQEREITLDALRARTGLTLTAIRDQLAAIVEGRLPSCGLQLRIQILPIYLNQRPDYAGAHWRPVTCKSGVQKLKLTTLVRLSDQGRKVLS